MFATCFTGFPEVEKDARRTVDAMAGNKGRTNQAKQASVFPERVAVRMRVGRNVARGY